MTHFSIQIRNARYANIVEGHPVESFLRHAMRRKMTVVSSNRTFVREVYSEPSEIRLEPAGPVIGSASPTRSLHERNPQSAMGAPPKEIDASLRRSKTKLGSKLPKSF